MGRKTLIMLVVGLMLKQTQPVAGTCWYYWPTAGLFLRAPLTTVGLLRSILATERKLYMFKYIMASYKGYSSVLIPL